MKKLLLFLTALCMALCIEMSLSAVFVSAQNTVYTFTDARIIKPSGTVDVENVKITDEISVTTSGKMNYKSVAVADMAHNKECGFSPSEDFSAEGSYIVFGTGNTNSDAVYTLNIPTIKKGSHAAITFCRPNVGRNSYDPYAYLKIGNRYITINGGEFNVWRTETVAVDTDVDQIDFICDKWGNIAISKIEVYEAGAADFKTLNITSSPYANITVNGVKFFANGGGILNLSSYLTGEELTVSAAKDGYNTAKKSVTIGETDTAVNLPLECENDYVYYESDFGNDEGTLNLDGEFNTGNIAFADVTRIFANVTLEENGNIALNTDNSPINISRKDNGVYINDTFITAKDNMEFELYFDKAHNKVFCVENGRETAIGEYGGYNTLTGILGGGAAIEYLGVSYPDTKRFEIKGPDKVSRIEGIENKIDYALDYDYTTDDKSKVYTLVIPAHAELGKMDISIDFNGSAYKKTVEVCGYPVLSDIKSNIESPIINLYGEKQLKMLSAYDPYGNEITYNLFCDFKSSDESVLRVDKNGKITAVGEGSATVTANAYTGADNPYSATLTVVCGYIKGICEADTSYIENTITQNGSITAYKLTTKAGAETEISPSQIPAAAIKKDGVLISAVYKDKKLYSAVKKEVKAGDKVPVSNGGKRVYLYAGGEYALITEADTTVLGFEINAEAGAEYEISPVYTFSEVGDVKDGGKTFDVPMPDGLYDITFKKSETRRGDIFVNGYMVGNNVDQADADRKLTDGALYAAEDIDIHTGSINVSMTDGSTMLDYITVEKTADFIVRPQRVYIIGDSLACIYYGSFEQEVGGGRSGWGQQIEDFLKVPVTNLANSGQYAAGLYKTAFPSVIYNGKEGDILLIECGYNDRNYSTRAEMTECVRNMIYECRGKGIIPIIVTPNASKHDYKPSVVWSGYLRDIAYDTDCAVIDLSKLSYDFLYSVYGDDKDNDITMNYNLTAVGGDTLHSSYAGAYMWAAIAAQGLNDLGYNIVNTDFQYTFTDTLGNTHTAAVK